MKKMILIIVMCTFTIISGYSQTKQESIKELIHLIHQDSLVDRMFTRLFPTNPMMSRMPQMQASKDSTFRAKRKLTNSRMGPIFTIIMKKMIDEDVPVLYDKYFTEDEVKDYISFYKSPSGQKMLKTQPDMQKDLLMIMMQKYLPIMADSIEAQGIRDKNIKAAKRDSTAKVK